MFGGRATPSVTERGEGRGGREGGEQGHTGTKTDKDGRTDGDRQTETETVTETETETETGDSDRGRGRDRCRDRGRGRGRDRDRDRNTRMDTTQKKKFGKNEGFFFRQMRGKFSQRHK